MKRYKDCFQKLDVDGNNVITSDELFVTLRHIVATFVGGQDTLATPNWDGFFAAIQQQLVHLGDNGREGGGKGNELQYLTFDQFVRAMDRLRENVGGAHHEAVDFLVGPKAKYVARAPK